MHTVEELKVKSARVAAKAGALIHAKRQLRKYPNSEASARYHTNALNEYLDAHNAYVDFANEELVGKEHLPFDGFGEDVDQYPVV